MAYRLMDYYVYNKVLQCWWKSVGANLLIYKRLVFYNIEGALFTILKSSISSLHFIGTSCITIHNISSIPNYSAINQHHKVPDYKWKVQS
jgi:hypothetical protein